ncbi:MAG: PAS domain-containing protein, partial [Sulfitobacter sp.]|nr:PAS domain-containing protein [Sulfitobacter sp.]
AYWEALRGTRPMPKRSEIDPRGIELALEYAFILERIAPGVARLRIAGSHLNELMGMEVRGMPLTAMFEAAGRKILGNILEEVTQMPATAELRLASKGGMGRPALRARMVLLPLRSDLGDASRVLGCLKARGDLGAAPRRFDITSSRVTPICPPAVTTAERQPEMGLAEGAAPFTGRPENGASTKAPYLRLVTSDDGPEE